MKAFSLTGLILWSTSGAIAWLPSITDNGGHRYNSLCMMEE